MLKNSSAFFETTHNSKQPAAGTTQGLIFGSYSKGFKARLSTCDQ